MQANKLLTFGLPALFVVILDQWSKHWLRTSPAFQNWDIIPGWLSFHYTLNPGMALGIDILSTQVVSVISIIATLGILGYVLYSMPHARLGYLFCMGLVMGGAFGNIIDRLIMGKIGGYGGILDGHVIDFIHFNATIQGYPVFPYIFNVADVAISTAIIALLLFHRRILPESRPEHSEESSRPEELQANAAEKGGGKHVASSE